MQSRFRLKKVEVQRDRLMLLTRGISPVFLIGRPRILRWIAFFLISPETVHYSQLTQRLSPPNAQANDVTQASVILTRVMLHPSVCITQTRRKLAFCDTLLNK